MRIASLLCWYDETPEFLAASVASLAQASVDVLVACDGAYADYPGGKPVSPPEQLEAVFRAAVSAGVEVVSYRPKGLWRSEMTKRTRLFDIAHHTDADWFLVLDADEVVINVPADLRSQLSSTPLQVAEVPILEHPHPTILHAEDADGQQMVMGARYVKYRRSFYKRQPKGIFVKGRHDRYVSGDGEQLWGDYLWGDEPVEALKIRDFVIDHRNTQRGVTRRDAALAYYLARDKSGIETVPR